MFETHPGTRRGRTVRRRRPGRRCSDRRCARTWSPNAPRRPSLPAEQVEPSPAARPVLRPGGRRIFAAPTNSRNNGCGRVGRDRSSGWNCPAMKNGWSGSSMISTSRPSGDRPENTSPCSCERLVVVGVDLLAVAVALVDDAARRRAARGARARARARRIASPAASSRPCRPRRLLGQQVDHGVRRLGVELGGVRALEPADVAGELDDRALQAQAEPEERARLCSRANRIASSLPSTPRPPNPPGTRIAVHVARAAATSWPASSSEGTQSIWTSTLCANPACFSASITER